MSKKTYTIEVFSIGGHMLKQKFKTEKIRDAVFEDIANSMGSMDLKVITNETKIIPLHAIDNIYKSVDYGT